MSTEDACKLFVAGLADSVTQDTLRQVFEAVGVEVLDVGVPTDRETGLPRGFGFVTLADAQQAQRAREELDGTTVAGKVLSVRLFHADPPNKRERTPRGRSNNRGEEDQGRTLYVGNLPYDCSEDELRELIGDEGQVDRIALPLDPNGRARGFGFVTMQSVEQAQGLIDKLSGVSLRGRRLVVNLARGRDGGAGASRGGDRRGRGARSHSGFRSSSGTEEPGHSYGSAGFAGAAQPPDIPRKTFDGRRRSPSRENRDH